MFSRDGVVFKSGVVLKPIRCMKDKRYSIKPNQANEGLKNHDAQIIIVLDKTRSFIRLEVENTFCIPQALFQFHWTLYYFT